jgi:acyl-CoA dehydrogenase
LRRVGVAAALLRQTAPLEHLYREVRAPRIYEGATEIQREIIARQLFRSAEKRRAGVKRT